MKKSLILFVHGINGSSTETWGKFPDLIRADAELAARFDVALDDYASRTTGRPFDRIGGLDPAAEGLRTRINNEHHAYSNIAVIAHSLGGPIVLRYVLDCLNRKEAFPVRRLLTFASPFHGATGASVLSIIGVGSAQSEDLATESPFMFRLQRDWDQFRDSHGIMIKMVVAGRDGVVGPASAAGLGNSYEFVSNCNHIDIVKPQSEADGSFIITKRFMLDEPASDILVNATTPNIDYADGSKIGGIKWHTGFSHLQLVFSNAGEQPCLDLDVLFETEYPIRDANAESDFSTIRVAPYDRMSLPIGAAISEDGTRIGFERVECDFSFETNYVFRFFCDRLPARARIKLDIATFQPATDAIYSTSAWSQIRRDPQFVHLRLQYTICGTQKNEEIKLIPDRPHWEEN